MQKPTFEIPDHVRQAADQSVEQAKKAFNDFLDATHKAVASAEASAKTLGEGAADVNRQALAHVEENIAASFDVAHRLALARSVEEMAAIQQEFLERQGRKIAEQGKSLGEMAHRAATDAVDKVKPKA